MGLFRYMLEVGAVSEQLDEMQERLRRLETRFVKLAEFLGFNSEVRRPRWLAPGGQIDIPSLDVSLRECLTTVPPSWPCDEPVLVIHKGEVVAELTVPSRSGE
jgi:hypothetical protein